MIRHCVFLRLSARADTAELDKIMLGLEELVRRLDGCSDFRAGPNRDYEGKTSDYPYGFTLDAENAKALAALRSRSPASGLGHSTCCALRGWY